LPVHRRNVRGVSAKLRGLEVVFIKMGQTNSTPLEAALRDIEQYAGQDSGGAELDHTRSLIRDTWPDCCHSDLPSPDGSDYVK
jgi:hypothetical protein